MKVRDVIKLVETDGWFLRRIKPGTVTIPGHPGKDMPEGTRNSVFKQAGLK